MRRQRRSTRELPVPEFVEILHANGWRCSHRPLMPQLGAGFDEWIFRLASDRLDHLFISGSTLEWERKRFSREPFGDYTNAYRDLGSGKGLESLPKK